MRIIAGEFRSRVLKSLPGNSVRPTSDRLRETLFNILGAAVMGATFVDAYAGTGAVGLEALSRGASQAIFLEQSKASLKILQQNIASLGVGSRCRVVEGPAHLGLRRIAAQAGIIFLDPSYADHQEYERALLILAAVPAQTLIVVEHESRWEPVAPPPLVRTRLKHQGDSALSFFQQLQSES